MKSNIRVILLFWCLLLIFVSKGHQLPVGDDDNESCDHGDTNLNPVDDDDKCSESEKESVAVS